MTNTWNDVMGVTRWLLRMHGQEGSLWEGIWAESWVTKSSQPTDNLEKSIPDKGRAQGRIKHPTLWGKERKPTWLQWKKEGLWEVREAVQSHDHGTSRPWSWVQIYLCELWGICKVSMEHRDMNWYVCWKDQSGPGEGNGLQGCKNEQGKPVS